MGQMGYEEDFVRYLQTIMTDVERRIRRGHARLIPREKDAPAGNVDNEKEDMLSTKINSLVDQVLTLNNVVGMVPLTPLIVQCSVCEREIVEELENKAACSIEL